MSVKDIKAEARHKLALNIHQAIIIYTIEFVIMTSVVALIVLACMCLSAASKVAAALMICYGIAVALVALIAIGIADFAMVDYYLASYRCKPYNIRRLGEVLARGNLTNILLLNLIRTLLGFLLLLCLIVPGVIYLVRTSMANHLLIANPKMKATTALKASSKVMSGRTGEYLALCCSYIGWWFLGILTLGLGFICVSPYMKLAKTVYYKRNLQGDKANYVAEPQPLSPPPQVPQENYADGRFVPAPPHGKKKQSTEPAVQPIATLGEDEMRRMNDAARLVTGAEVQEVVIPMPTAVPPEQPVNDSFTETVKPLTTLEVMESDVDSKKFDEMFAELQRQAREIEAEKADNVQDANINVADGDAPSPKAEQPQRQARSALARDRVRTTERPDRAARRPSARPVTRENAVSSSANDVDANASESREEKMRRERRERIERNNSSRK